MEQGHRATIGAPEVVDGEECRPVFWNGEFAGELFRSCRGGDWTFDHVSGNVATLPDGTWRALRNRLATTIRCFEI